MIFLLLSIVFFGLNNVNNSKNILTAIKDGDIKEYDLHDFVRLKIMNFQTLTLSHKLCLMFICCVVKQFERGNDFQRFFLKEMKYLENHQDINDFATLCFDELRNK